MSSQVQPSSSRIAEHPGMSPPAGAESARRTPFARATGMYARRSKTLLDQFQALVFHQGDQRRNHQHVAAARHARKLVAQRLARAGRHDQQAVMPLRYRRARLLLMRPKALEPEARAKNVAQFRHAAEYSPRQACIDFQLSA